MPGFPENLSRRIFIAAVGGTAASLVHPGTGWGADSDYPSRNIDFIIPKAPGGGFDSLVRVIAPVVERYLPHKVNIVPDNIPAGGGGKGISQLCRSKPDGYTIGAVDIPGSFVLQSRQGGAGFDLSKITWLCLLGQPESYGIGVAANSPLKSVDDLRALSKKRPVKFTSSGPEGTAYAATVIGTKILGINTQIITGYKGSSDFVVGAMRGDGDAVVAPVTALRPMQTAKTLRVLATFERQATFQGIPDASALGHPELGDILLLRLVGAPPGLPAGTRTLLSTAFRKAIADPQAVSLAKKLDVTFMQNTPEQASQMVRDGAALFEKWKKYLTV